MKSKLKNIIIIFGLCLIFTACEKKEENRVEIAATAETMEEQNLSIPNPFIEVKTLDEASKIAGFTLTVPEIYKDYKNRVIQAIENDMIEVIYFDEETEHEGLRIRKAKGTDDISGDYNEYQSRETIKVGDLEVTEKGNNGDISVVIWNDGTYSYAIDVDEAKLNSEDIANIIANIK